MGERTMRKWGTGSWLECIRERAQLEPEFGHLMFARAVKCFVEGDLTLCKGTLHDYVYATIGFAELGRLLGKSPRSVKRMLSNGSNPRSADLFAVIEHLQKAERVEIEVSCDSAKPRARKAARKTTGEAAVA